MKGETVEAPIQVKPAEGGEESRVPMENSWYSEPRSSSDPVWGVNTHACKCICFQGMQPHYFQTKILPSENPPLEKERQLCYFFLFPCPCPCPFLPFPYVEGKADN